MPEHGRLAIQRHFVIMRAAAVTQRGHHPMIRVVWTAKDRAMAAGLSVDLDRWRHEFDELVLRAGARFARVEPRQRMAAFIRGLLAGLPRVRGGCPPLRVECQEPGVQHNCAATEPTPGNHDGPRITTHPADSTVTDLAAVSSHRGALRRRSILTRATHVPRRHATDARS